MILYFSGTGNSEYVAEKIAAQTGDAVLSLNDLIRENDHRELTSESPWIIVAPTYAWQLPDVVRDWMLQTKLSGNRNAYFVLTCGSSVGKAGVYAKRLCRSIGLEYMGLADIVMPENYIAMFRAPEEEEARKIVKAAEPKISIAVNRIRKGTVLPVHRTFMWFFDIGLIHPLFYSLCVKDGPFTVSDACSSCGLCESLCPLNNVKLRDGKPVWNGHCTHCMACVCHCPEKAIEYGRASRGKPRYTCPPM